ncbi:MAG TPA: trehalose-phosphatase [Gemmatimonadaceae bacterium]|nr:trehalose-phosphatase [Gemmatimonadaceae bacterium]
MTPAEPDEIAQRLRGTPLIIMLDIDGTLCDIVERADVASIPGTARESLRTLIGKRDRGVHVAFVTGRSVADARRMLSIGGVTIYGNHGMEHLSESGNITGPEGWEDAGLALRDARSDLDAVVARFPGTSIEDKGFSLTLHFREMDMALLPALDARVAEIARARGVTLAPGKCVINILASESLTKGDAVLEIVHELGGESPDASILFAGDDVTDEDGFRALRAFPHATTVRVGAPDATTDAQFSVDTPREIHDLLDLLAASRS